MIEQNLRGELTIHRDRNFEDLELVRAIADSLKVSTSQEMERLRLQLYPAIVCAIAGQGDVEALKSARDVGADLSSHDYDFRTPLHLAVSNGCIDVVEYLLTQG